MTIALGMLTRFGLVLAADSQEGSGVAGDFKLGTSKIRAFSSGRVEGVATVTNGIGITGAGDSAYLTALKYKVVTAFEKATSNNCTLDDFETHVEGLLEDFYRTHVRPFDRKMTGYLDADLIIGAQIGGGQRLWVTRRATVTPSENFVAVGSGETWARYALSGFFSVVADERSAGIAAAYAVYVAKERAEGCGMDTQMIFLPLPPGVGLHLADTGQIRTLEECFRKYEDAERVNRWKAFAGYEFGETALPMGDFLDKIKAELSSFHPFPSFTMQSASQASADQH